MLYIVLGKYFVGKGITLLKVVIYFLFGGIGGVINIKIAMF